MPIQPLIFVAGDPTIDWAIGIPEKGPLAVEQRLRLERNRAAWHYGGAFLLEQLIDAAVKRGAKSFKPEVLPNPSYADRGRPAIDAPDVHHTYNTIRQCSSDRRERWRIAQFFGLVAADQIKKIPGRLGSFANGRLSVVAIDDAGLGFGNTENVSQILKWGKEDPPWIVLKLGTRSFSDSNLWQEINSRVSKEFDRGQETVIGPRLCDRLIVVVKVEDLRQAGAEVSADLSWERSAQDILAELKRNPKLSSLRQCRRVVVSFGATGSFLMDLESPDPYKYTLFFDREYMEESWSWKNEKSGYMFGYSLVLTAELAARFASSNITPKHLVGAPDSGQCLKVHNDLADGVMTALREIRRAHQEGFEIDKQQLCFPRHCMQVSGKGDGSIGRSAVPDPVLTDPPPAVGWSILNKKLEESDPYNLAMKVAQKGWAIALTDVPIAQFGTLTTADRKEIEGLRSLRKLITEYWNDPRKTVPRSVAIFGAPGDGKSFAVREVVSGLQREGEKRNALEFNISQFSSPEVLVDAFHQIRDRCLGGEIPLVFWDEFDTPLGGVGLGWLRHFLAPMQDGRFQEGQITHPIGRAIFAFAGGTCKTFEDFSRKTSDPQYVDAKGADFISRLSGYLNVIGPNTAGGRLIDEPHRIIHRALLLNSLLTKRKVDPESDVDIGVICAFLQISHYRHGARSMQAIIDMSHLPPGLRYSRSSLPPPTQLNLHVDAEEFMRIARRADASGGVTAGNA